MAAAQRKRQAQASGRGSAYQYHSSSGYQSSWVNSDDGHRGSGGFIGGSSGAVGGGCGG